MPSPYRSSPYRSPPLSQVFGFHANAAITSATNDTQYMFSTVLALQPRTSAGEGMSREDAIDALAVDIAGRIPGPYDMEPVALALQRTP